jgi:hypothetical protein
MYKIKEYWRFVEYLSELGTNMKVSEYSYTRPEGC